MRVEFVVNEVYVYLNIEEVARNLELCQKYSGNATFDDNCLLIIMKKDEFIKFIEQFQSPVLFEGTGLDRVLISPEIAPEVKEVLEEMRKNFAF